MGLTANSPGHWGLPGQKEEGLWRPGNPFPRWKYRGPAPDQHAPGRCPWGVEPSSVSRLPATPAGTWGSRGKGEPHRTGKHPGNHLGNSWPIPCCSLSNNSAVTSSAGPRGWRGLTWGRGAGGSLLPQGPPPPGLSISQGQSRAPERDRWVGRGVNVRKGLRADRLVQESANRTPAVRPRSLSCWARHDRDHAAGGAPTSYSPAG